MVLTPLAVALGLVVGLVRGGRPGNILRAGVRWWPLVPVGVGLQLAAERIETPARLGMLVAALFLLAAWATRNVVRVPGSAVIALGLALDLAVVVANGHVPVRWESLEAVGRVTADQRPLARTDGLFQVETDETRLAPLGEIIPLPVLELEVADRTIEFREVVSFGDLILLAGVMVFSANVLLAPRRLALRPPRRGPPRRRRPRRDGISPDELFADDPLPPAVTVRPVDLRQPLPDWSDHTSSSSPPGR
jgi:hypothetical protein